MNYDLNNPQPGHYRIRLVRGGPFVPVKIMRACVCTVNGGDEQARHDWRETCDRSPVLVALVNGRDTDMDRVWPWCARFPIAAQEYAYMMARKSWAEDYHPAAPEAQPKQKINLMKTPIPF